MQATKHKTLFGVDAFTSNIERCCGGLWTLLFGNLRSQTKHFSQTSNIWFSNITPNF